MGHLVKGTPGRAGLFKCSSRKVFMLFHVPSNTPDSDTTQKVFEYVMLLYTLKIPEEPKEPKLVTPFNVKRNSLFHSHYLLLSSGICSAFLKIFHQQRTKLRTKTKSTILCLINIPRNKKCFLNSLCFPAFFSTSLTW